MLPVAVARSSSDNSALCMYFRFADDVIYAYAIWCVAKRACDHPQ